MNPVPAIPETDLPITPRLGEVIDLLTQRPALVLKAEPGAGKTSLVPLALSKAWPEQGKVLVLEPRRVAAVQSAARVAELLGEGPGNSVGYRVRGDSKSGRHIEFVTEGVFLRMIQEDPSLEGVGSLIFDEFHERSIHGDLGLALALEARSTFRPELRLVLMSATMKVEALAAFIDGNYLEVEGRSFPVDTQYRALTEGPGFSRTLADLAFECLKASNRRSAGDRAKPGGDVLVFLPGVAEIEELARCLSEKSRLEGTVPEILALHGGLPLEHQRRIVTPGGPRQGSQRIILATSIAETSLTVPGISAVLDVGLARLTRFELRSGLNRLVTERESRDRADQRRGRAGRLGPGFCLRAWAEAEGLPETTQPEILRAELSALVLESSAWGALSPKDLPWLDLPPLPAWEAAQDLLMDLGAIDRYRRPTELGLACLKMGTEPRLGILVLQGKVEGRLKEAAGLAALMAERGGAKDDLEHALGALASGRPDLALCRAEAARLEKAALATSWGSGKIKGSASSGGIGSLLAAGFPDRVAKRLEFGGGKALFQLPGGRKLTARGSLAESPWIVAAEAEAGGGRFAKTGEGRVFSGAALGEAEALEALSPVLVEEERIEWEGLRARAKAVRRAGVIVLSERALGRPSQDAVATALGERIRKEGLGILPWEDGAGEILERLRFFEGRRIQKLQAWPGLDEENLLANLEQWLLPFVEVLSSGLCLSGPGLRSAILALIPSGQGGILEKEVPASLVLPSGKKARLEYDIKLRGPGASLIGPALDARPQDLYGLRLHPKILGYPILVRLLSPAGRPIHLTTDLPGFWKGAWLEVRKDLKGRYPKHDWPEDPGAALPKASGTRRS